MRTQQSRPSPNDLSPVAVNLLRRFGAGAMLLVFALTISACRDADIDAVNESGTLEKEGDMTMRNGMASDHIVAVSIVNGGEIVPTMPAGRTTLTVDNTGQEDCVFTMEPISDAGMRDGNSATDGRAYDQGADRSGDPSMQDRADGGGISEADPNVPGSEPEDESLPSNPEAGLSSEDQAGTLGGEAGPGTLHNGSTNRVTAGQATTVTMELEPGIYQATCSESSEGPTPDDSDALIVMVTDEALAPGSRRGNMDDNLGTDVVPETGSGARK